MPFRGRNVRRWSACGGIRPASFTPARSNCMGTRTLTLVGPSCPSSSESTWTRRYLAAPSFRVGWFCEDDPATGSSSAAIRRSASSALILTQKASAKFDGDVHSYWTPRKRKSRFQHSVFDLNFVSFSARRICQQRKTRRRGLCGKPRSQQKLAGKNYRKGTIQPEHDQRNHNRASGFPAAQTDNPPTESFNASIAGSHLGVISPVAADLKPHSLTESDSSPQTPDSRRSDWPDLMVG